MKPALTRLTVLVAALVAVAAVACGPRESRSSRTIMRIGVASPRQGARGSGLGSVVSQLRADTWLSGRPDGTQAERIASDWSWDDSRTVLRLKLRSDVYFHDGTRLTPEIAVEALRKSVAHAAEEGASSFLSITSVAVSGPDSVEIRLSEPNAFVVPDLSLVSVRLPGNDAISTGPFRVVSQMPKEVVLEAFPQYYRKRPAVDEIRITSYPTQRNAWAALMRGEIDMLHDVSRDAAEFVEAETMVRTYSFPRPYYIPLVFNVVHPVLKSAVVRKAINEALDRSVLVSAGLVGHGRPADGPIWPEHWAHSSTEERFRFNPEMARRRLDEAGLTVQPRADGSMPSRFSFTCLVWANDARFERLALLVQKQLADVGIDMQLLPVKSPEIEQRVMNGNFDAYLLEMFGRSLTYAYEFWRSREHGLQKTGYRGADAVFDRIRGARSDDEVRAAVAELDRVLQEDPPAAFLAWQTTTRAVSTKFDVSPEPNRDILANAWLWRPAETRTLAAR